MVQRELETLSYGALEQYKTVQPAYVGNTQQLLWEQCWGDIGLMKAYIAAAHIEYARRSQVAEQNPAMAGMQDLMGMYYQIQTAEKELMRSLQAELQYLGGGKPGKHRRGQRGAKKGRGQARHQGRRSGKSDRNVDPFDNPQHCPQHPRNRTSTRRSERQAKEVEVAEARGGPKGPAAWSPSLSDYCVTMQDGEVA